LRFLLDHDIDASVRHVVIKHGHECWTAAAAGRFLRSDEELAIYAHDRDAALVSHDREFAKWRMRRTYGQHIWLRCPEPDAVTVMENRLDEIVATLEKITEVVVEVGPKLFRVHPARWD
jgi:predicted nuclease of predicted toxin-antitoxin system